MACGAFHTAVVTVNGKVFTWGREEHGMLGHDVPPDNFYDAQDRPKEVEGTEHMGVRCLALQFPSVETSTRGNPTQVMLTVPL